MITISEYYIQKDFFPFVRLHDECLSSNSDVDFAILVPVFSVSLFNDVIFEMAAFRFMLNLISSESGVIAIVVFVIVWDGFFRKDL